MPELNPAVEPFYKGHFVTSHFVPCWEVIVFLHGKEIQKSVLICEAVPSSGGPLHGYELQPQPFTPDRRSVAFYQEVGPFGF